MSDNSIGLKSLRNGVEGKPKYHCENCKCNRYNPCKCTRSDKKEKQQTK